MFKDHGTKIIGTIFTLAGTFAAFSPEQVLALLGERGPGIVVALGGLATVLRGLQNSGILPGGPKKE